MDTFSLPPIINLLSVIDEFGNTKLHSMAMTGNIMDLYVVISHKKVAKIRNNNGDTPLHVLGSFLCKDIIYHPMTHKVKNKYGQTPLHCFAIHGGYDLVLKHKYAGRVKDNNGDTPLHYAARASEDGVVLHADVNRTKNRVGKTPLDILIGLNNYAVLDFPGITDPIDGNGNTILHKLAQAGNPMVLNHPLVHVVSEYANGRSPLHLLAMHGYSSILENEYNNITLDFHDMTPLDYLIQAQAEPTLKASIAFAGC